MENILSKWIKRYLFGNISDDEVRKRLYNNLEPAGYGNMLNLTWGPERIVYTVKNNKSEYEDSEKYYKENPELEPVTWENRDDIFATYLGIPENERRNIPGIKKVIDAQYLPSKNTQNTNYKKIDRLTDFDKKQLVDSGITLEHGKNKVSDPLKHYFYQHTVGRGFDDKGDYVSYYDLWDINPFAGKDGTTEYYGIPVPKKLQNTTKDLSFGIGKPIEFYDRIYLDDYYDIPEEARGNPFIAPAVITNKKGGILKYQNPSSPLLVQRVNQSDANFVKRLLDPNRKHIQD